MGSSSGSGTNLNYGAVNNNSKHNFQKQTGLDQNLLQQKQFG